jgi:hypothetical protein
MTTHAARGPLAAIALWALSGCSGRDVGPGLVISIQPQSAALCVGDSLSYTAVAHDGAGRELPGTPIRWGSSAPKVVSIDTASGLARALALGATQISATAGGAVATAPLDVPADLVPEFVPDSAVLAPGDTMTLGVRLRRVSSGPVPASVPRIAPLDSGAASLDTTGLITARTAGRVGLSLSACGRLGGGAVDVFVPPDSATGKGYLWLSGGAELRVRLPAQVNNFTRTSGQPAFQVFGVLGGGARSFVYEDTVSLGGPGLFPLDSLSSTEAVSTLPCAPPRPFATYADQAQPTVLLGMTGGWMRITRFVPQAGYTAVSGRAVFRMRGIVAGAAQLDTVAAIYTFSAPLVGNAKACH